MDPSRGSAPASQGLGAEVSVPTDAPPSGAGQLVGAQVGLSVLTSGLTAVQAEEIFLLSREIQTLHGKLALDFIKMSHTEANFRMGAQAASHESTVQESRVRPGCTSILYSSITLSIINSSWYGSSIGARRLSRLYMIAFGKWSIGLWKVQADLQQTV